ncbi:hypothetical protein LOY67_20735 [Pseudomonas sp. B21-056]|uniref:hypothetical protein n=1 Tax=Pseudomonas sp. B21-056 TaxID=2895495 RepID=UPI002231C4BC|nr:hypothetical protein [Pseudomonas sp. B21-056]UZE22436.1 hypothetical protein LOY67_20735 [Pseudomonas sp. B21-056]
MKIATIPQAGQGAAFGRRGGFMKKISCCRNELSTRLCGSEPARDSGASVGIDIN